MTDAVADFGRFYEEIGRKLDAFGERITARLDHLAAEQKDSGERLVRIETMQQAGSRETQDLRDSLKTAQSDLKTSNAAAAALDKRVVRLETLIVPGMSIVAAVASALISHYLK